jgi:O-antigen/teichoic acid export membrane protein
MTPHEQSLDALGVIPASRESFGTLARRAASVLGSHAVAAALGIASLPVLARALGPAQYGRFSLFLTLLGVVTYQDFLRPLLVRALAGSDRDDRGLRALSACVSWALACAAVALGALLFEPLVAALFAFAVLAHGLASVDYARLALCGRIAGAAFVRNIAWGLAAVLAAALAATEFGGRSLPWVAAPFCAANVAILCVYRARVGGAATNAWNKDTLGHARAAWNEHRGAIVGLVGFGMANALVVSADRLIAERFLDAHAFGLYAGCADLATKLAIVGSALGTVIYPSFARNSDGSDAESRRFVAIASRVLLAWAAVIAVLVVAASPLVELVLGADYAGGAWICAALFAASFVHMLGFLVTPWQRARGEFLAQTRSYAVAGIAMVVVGCALIPLLGIAGAVACACTARLAEIQLGVREMIALPRRILTARHVGSLGALAIGIALLAWWRVGGLR